MRLIVQFYRDCGLVAAQNFAYRPARRICLRLRSISRSAGENLSVKPNRSPAISKHALATGRRAHSGKFCGPVASLSFTEQQPGYGPVFSVSGMQMTTRGSRHRNLSSPHRALDSIDAKRGILVADGVLQIHGALITPLLHRVHIIKLKNDHTVGRFATGQT
jgi:hypothetical protein